MTPTQLLQSGDVQLAVYTWGEAPTQKSPKPVVLLVHGYPDAASVWRQTAEILAERYFVVAYDVRGAGLSSQPANQAGFGLEYLVADMAVVIDALSPNQPVHLVGHDWGSVQSWESVTTERLKGRIASYTTVSGPCLDHIGHWLAKRLRSGSSADLASLAKQAAHSWYVGVFHLPGLGPALWKMGLDKLWPSVLEKIEGIPGALHEKSETQTQDGISGINLYRANVGGRVLKPRERKTDLPVQLIQPLKDHFITAATWDDLPNWAPKLWRRDINAGHWLQISHSAQFAQWVSEFVEFVETGVESLPLVRARNYGKNSGKPYAGKLVVITGAGNGFGRETALMCAERGANVVAVDINLEACDRTAELCSLMGATAWSRQVDVGNAEQMEALAQWVGKEFGAPDIVVNNAGIGVAGSFFDTSNQDWQKVLQVNLWGVILGSRLFGEQMLAAGKHGSIVNVASMGGFTPSRFMSAYNTSKAAVMMLSDCLRGELASRHIHVATICPGLANTGITQRTRFVGTTEAEQTEKRSKSSALYQRRNLKTETIAAAILEAIDHKHDEVLVGVEAKGSRLLGRLLPSLIRSAARLNLAP